MTDSTNPANSAFRMLPGNELQVGDIIVDANATPYDEVIEVHQDIDGTWVEFYHGDMGYADLNTYRVELS